MSNPTDTEAAKASQTTDSQAVGCRAIVRELYEVLAYVRPLVWVIAEDGGEPPWRKAKAEKAIGKIDAAMIAADSLPNEKALP